MARPSLQAIGTVLLSFALVAGVTSPASVAAPVATSDAPFVDVPADSPFVDEITWLVDQGITQGYPDGTFRPTNTVTRQAFAAFLYRLDGQPAGGACASGPAPFTDVPVEQAFCSEITWLASTGITTGYSDGTFRPAAAVTRQAIAAFLYRYSHFGEDLVSADGPCASSDPFPDVAAAGTFCEAIRWMSSVGPEPITTGYPDGGFQPTSNASRQAIAAWLYRYRIDHPLAEERLEYEAAAATIEGRPTDVVDLTTTAPTPDDPTDDIPTTAPDSTTVVILTSGAVPPAVGDKFVIPPAPGAVAAAGVGGVVLEVEVADDGTVRVTVGPAPLDELFDSLHLVYDGPLDTGSGDVVTAGRTSTGLDPASIIERSSPGTLASEWSQARAQAIGAVSCRDADGQEIDAGNENSLTFGLTFENTRAHFDLDLGIEPSVTVWMYTEPVLEMSASVKVALTCHIVLPSATFVPVVGLEINVGPYIDFEVGGAASLKLTQRFYRTTGFEYSDGVARDISRSSNDPVSFKVTGTVNAKLAAGAKVEVSVIGRVGIYLKLGPALTLAATASAGGESSLCASVTGEVTGSVGAYLDAFVSRWTFEFGSFSIELLKWEKCYGEDDLPPDVSGLSPGSVSVFGGMILVQGDRLDRTSSVRWDGAAVPFLIESKHAVRVTIPAGDAKVGKLVLTTPTGEAQLNLRRVAPPPAVSVDAGANHGVMVLGDGSVLGWGSNNVGQLGLGNSAGHPGFVSMTGVPPIVQVAAGGDTTYALDADGGVWAWGTNADRQRGPSGLIYYGIANQIEQLPPVVRVEAGYNYAMAIDENGALWKWGEGNGTPTRVNGVSDVIQVVPTNRGAAVLTGAGEVWAWGYNMYGQLGQGTVTPGPTVTAEPGRVPGLSDVVEISAGDLHVLALTSTGAVYGWGNNIYGQLGQGTTNSINSSPIAVPGLPAIAHLSSGQYFTLALATDGAVWAWGDNSQGQIGNGGAGIQSAATQLSGLPSVQAVTTGVYGQSYATTSDGSIYRWGSVFVPFAGYAQRTPVKFWPVP